MIQSQVVLGRNMFWARWGESLLPVWEIWTMGTRYATNTSLRVLAR